ncbi:SCO-spondin-like [Tachypleus tridentatus]|uniref:SCO-spondin-like n=1 Tax=Tachypleus tridentatus TaxID=6853 RepID=UPI003FD17B9B
MKTICIIVFILFVGNVTEEASGQEECLPEMEWKECAPCPATCQDVMGTCSEDCVSGCYCLSEKVKYMDKCITVSDCRSLYNTTNA